MSVILHPLQPDHLPAAVQLLLQLNPTVPAEELRSRLDTILHDHPHYEAHGAFENDRLIGLVGAWIATKIWCGRYLEIDNLVVAESHRSCGIGSTLIRFLESRALALDCRILVLDSYVSNVASHRLYERLGFDARGLHFVKDLSPL